MNIQYISDNVKDELDESPWLLLYTLRSHCANAVKPDCCSQFWTFPVDKFCLVLISVFVFYLEMIHSYLNVMHIGWEGCIH